MTGCLRERDLQAWLDGALSTEVFAAVQTHLSSCEVCAERARAAKQVMALVHDAWQAGLPDRVPTAKLLAGIEKKLSSQPASADGWWPHIAFARWKTAAAIAVLAVAVLGAVASRFENVTLPMSESGAGISQPKDSVARTVPLSRNSRTRAAGLAAETNKHLGQTQLLLRSIRNAEDDAVSDLAYERELSRELLSRNRLLRRRAEQRDLQRAEELLSHIEPILLDIANLPEQPAPEEMRSLKELIRSQQIIAELQLYTGKNLF